VGQNKGKDGARNEDRDRDGDEDEGRGEGKGIPSSLFEYVNK
jgi:hypothetical protein